MERLSGSVAVLETPPASAQGTDANTAPARQGAVRSDLVVRAGPHARVRAGAQIPPLVDLGQLDVFDHTGRRICPAPDELPSLEEQSDPVDRHTRRQKTRGGVPGALAR